MYKWFSLLSTRQRSEMVAIVLIITMILGVGVVTNLPKEKTTSEIFTTDMSIRDIAPKLEVTGKASSNIKDPISFARKLFYCTPRFLKG